MLAGGFFATEPAGEPGPDSPVQSLSRVQLFATPWTAARQASLSIRNSRSLLKFMSIESVMPSNHRILCRPSLLSSSVFPSIRVFSNESALRIRWPKYWSFSFNISPSSEYSGVISFRMDWLNLFAVQGTLKRPESSYPQIKQYSTCAVLGFLLRGGGVIFVVLGFQVQKPVFRAAKIK